MMWPEAVCTVGVTVAAASAWCFTMWRVTQSSSCDHPVCDCPPGCHDEEDEASERAAEEDA